MRTLSLRSTGIISLNPCQLVVSDFFFKFRRCSVAFWQLLVNRIRYDMWCYLWVSLSIYHLILVLELWSFELERFYGPFAWCQRGAVGTCLVIKYTAVSERLRALIARQWCITDSAPSGTHHLHESLSWSRINHFSLFPLQFKGLFG